MATSSNSRGLMLLLLTSGFFLTGLLFDYTPMIVDSAIKRTLELATNDEIKEIWSKPPVDLNTYYWLYEVLNTDQFMSGAEKIRVRKVGPYHFTSRIEKRIIELSANKYRLIYNTTRRIHLNESSARQHDMDRRIKLLNPVYVGLIEGVREFGVKMDPQMRPMVMSSMNRLTERFNESLIIEMSAREFLVGRKVEMFDKLRKMASTFSDGDSMPGMPPMPEAVKTGWFGLVSVQNNSWSGPFEIYTGYQASQPSLGDIISYMGKRRLTEFSGRCNRLQASAGELRPMPITVEQTLEIYQPQLCRIVHLKPTGQRKVREGLAVAYQLAPEDFLSAELNPDNRCYCVNGTTNNYCSLSGVLEVAPCTMWAPIVATFNNLALDPRVSDTIQDFDPELLSSDAERLPKSDTAGQMLILNRLGVPVQVDLTSTLFMKVIRDSKFRQTLTVPEVSYIPMAMVREMVTIPPKLGKIIIDLESFLALTRHLRVVMYLSALVLLCWLAGHYFERASKDKVQPAAPASLDDDHSPTGAASSTSTTLTTTAVSNGGPAPVGNGHSVVAGADSASMSPADSSRSHRASRLASQSSVDPGLTSGGGDIGERLKREIGVASRQVARESETSQAGGGGKKLAFIFSQVDELAAGKTGGGGVWTEAKDKQSAAAGADDAEAASSELADENDDDGDELKGSRGEPDRQRVSGAARRGGWLVKVASNFLRILNGLRTTISDVGQLEIGENDYQDKQLELLAGKIDNWQRYSSTTNVSSNEPSAGADAASELAALDATSKQEIATTTTETTKSSNPVDEQSGGHEVGQPALADAEIGEESRKVDGMDGCAERGANLRKKRDVGEQVTAAASGDHQTPDGSRQASAGAQSAEPEARNEATAGESVERQTTASSVQSSKTIINNKSGDTSGDESTRGSGGGASSSLMDDSSVVVDKAAALEQMELALSASAAAAVTVAASGGSAADGDEGGGQKRAATKSGDDLAPDQQRGDESNHSDTTTAAAAAAATSTATTTNTTRRIARSEVGVVMINSSTSIDESLLGAVERWDSASLAQKNLQSPQNWGKIEVS